MLSGFVWKSMSYLFKTNYNDHRTFKKVNIYHKLSGSPSLDVPITTRLLGKTGSLK